MKKLVNLDTWVEHIVHIDEVTGSRPAAAFDGPINFAGFFLLRRPAL